MVRVRFTGRVLPEALHISIDNHPSIKWIDEELTHLGLDVTCNVTIQKSTIIAECVTNKFEKDAHLMPLFMRAFDIARASVDLVAFGTGSGLLVIFDTFTDQDGRTTALVAEQPELSAIASSLFGDGFDTVLRLVVTDPPVFRALRDLIDAITFTHIAPTNCGRAIEGLRHAMAPGADRKQQWAKMRENLRIDQSYLSVITDLSGEGSKHRSAGRERPPHRPAK